MIMNNNGCLRGGAHPIIQDPAARLDCVAP